MIKFYIFFDRLSQVNVKTFYFISYQIWFFLKVTSETVFYTFRIKKTAEQFKVIAFFIF